MRNWKKTGRQGILVLAAALLLGGCGTRETLSSGQKSEHEYGRAETMVILTTERLRYEELYSEEIWAAAVDNRGTTFESALLSQVHDFLKELKLMSGMAKESGIALTGRETDLVKEAAGQYLDNLGDQNAAKFELEAGDVEALYTDYWSAQKLVEQLTGNVNLEVSDSEAKVITVAQIALSDRATAEEVHAKALEEGASFSSIAREYSEEEEIELQIYRGLMGGDYEEAAFALENEEISSVIFDSGKYYILKCVNDYDEEATKIRKEEMMRQKKNEVFFAAYQVYKEEILLTEDKELWQSLSVTGSPAVEADFFEIYQEICLQEANAA